MAILALGLGIATSAAGCSGGEEPALASDPSPSTVTSGSSQPSPQLPPPLPPLDLDAPAEFQTASFGFG